MGREDGEPALPALPVITADAYEIDIGPHVFPTRKYRLVRDRLLAEGTISVRDLIRPQPATDDQIRLVHTADYVTKIRTDTLSIDERIRLEVPFSAALRAASWLCAGGSIECGRCALERGVAVHLGGGFHHAFAGHGEGFCLVNDVAVAIRVLHGVGAIRRSMVIDLDVHHGNGTAMIFAEDPVVFTFSMHQQANYPAWKPAGDLDIGLADGMRDAEYLALLEENLPGIVGEHRPELAFYLAGADPYERDQLGGLGLTVEGLARRDEAVLRTLRDAGVAVAITLAGGYAIDPRDTVEIHCNTVRAAKRVVEARR